MPSRRCSSSTWLPATWQICLRLSRVTKTLQWTARCTRLRSWKGRKSSVTSGQLEGGVGQHDNDANQGSADRDRVADFGTWSWPHVPDDITVSSCDNYPRYESIEHEAASRYQTAASSRPTSVFCIPSPSPSSHPIPLSPPHVRPAQHPTLPTYPPPSPTTLSTSPPDPRAPPRSSPKHV